MEYETNAGLLLDNLRVGNSWHLATIEPGNAAAQSRFQDNSALDFEWGRPNVVIPILLGLTSKQNALKFGQW